MSLSDPPKGAALISVDTTTSSSIAHTACRAAADKKAENIKVLDIGDLLGITDYFVICSARNDRQLGTVVDEIQFRLKQEGHAPRRREGAKDTGWMLLDYGVVVVHAFTDEQRSFYDLERLWADAPTAVYDEESDELVDVAPDRGLKATAVDG